MEVICIKIGIDIDNVLSNFNDTLLNEYLLHDKELKLKGIKVLAKLNNCKLNEILFIDDNLDVIMLLEKNDVKAIHISNIS